MRIVFYTSGAEFTTKTDSGGIGSPTFVTDTTIAPATASAPVVTNFPLAKPAIIDTGTMQTKSECGSGGWRSRRRRMRKASSPEELTRNETWQGARPSDAVGGSVCGCERAMQAWL